MKMETAADFLHLTISDGSSAGGGEVQAYGPVQMENCQEGGALVAEGSAVEAFDPGGEVRGYAN